MPKSRVRKKVVYTPPAEIRPEYRRRRPSRPWVPITAVVLMVLGVVWLIVYYLSQGLFPVGAIGGWNLAVGFAPLVVALGLLTQWR